jgi:hypothetical protein
VGTRILGSRQPWNDALETNRTPNEWQCVKLMFEINLWIRWKDRNSSAALWSETFLCNLVRRPEIYANSGSKKHKKIMEVTITWKRRLIVASLKPKLELAMQIEQEMPHPRRGRTRQAQCYPNCQLQCPKNRRNSHLRSARATN